MISIVANIPKPLINYVEREVIKWKMEDNQDMSFLKKKSEVVAYKELSGAKNTIVYDKINYSLEMSLFRAGIAKRHSALTSIQAGKLRAIAKLIQYKNVAVVSREELLEALGIRDNHLNRELTRLSPHIRFSTSRKHVGMSHVKIQIAPYLFYVQEQSKMEECRHSSMMSWWAGTEMELYINSLEASRKPLEGLSLSTLAIGMGIDIEQAKRGLQRRLRSQMKDEVCPEHFSDSFKKNWMKSFGINI